MRDRIPGAPGQYRMTVLADESQKILTGEEVTIKLVRDDQPVIEGTPYNKASVLPDSLAEKICPGVDDPTPADAFEGLSAKYYTVTLLTADWVGTAAPYTQTISVVGILSTDRPHFGVVYSEDQQTRLAQKEAFALVDALDTADGAVTFTCFEDRPGTDIPIQMEVNR